MRDDESVYIVWKDTKVVTVCTTEHDGHSEGTVSHNWKDKDYQQQTNKKRCSHTNSYLQVQCFHGWCLSL